jgi:hypothetical protein
VLLPRVQEPAQAATDDSQPVSDLLWNWRQRHPLDVVTLAADCLDEIPRPPQVVANRRVQLPELSPGRILGNRTRLLKDIKVHLPGVKFTSDGEGFQEALLAVSGLMGNEREHLGVLRQPGNVSRVQKDAQAEGSPREPRGSRCALARKPEGDSVGLDVFCNLPSQWTRVAERGQRAA